MGAEMHVQRLQRALGQRTRGDGEARPGEDGGGEELDVVFLALSFNPVGFGARFDHVGQFIVGARVGLEQAVERGVDIVLGTVFEQAVDDIGELRFPVGVFQLAAGFGKAGGQTLQFGRVAGKTVARAKAGAFHRVSRKFKDVILPAAKMTHSTNL